MRRPLLLHHQQTPGAFRFAQVTATGPGLGGDGQRMLGRKAGSSLSAVHRHDDAVGRRRDSNVETVFWSASLVLYSTSPRCGADPNPGLKGQLSVGKGGGGVEV